MKNVATTIAHPIEKIRNWLMPSRQAMNKVTPAIRWRDDILRLMDPRKINSVEDRYAYLLQIHELEYKNSKQEMQILREQGLQRDGLPWARKRKLSKLERDRKEMCSIGIYLASVVLLSFGRLEVVEDVLLYAPPEPHPLRRHYLNVLRNLFPLPQELKLSDDWAEIIAWILQNREHLLWSEEAGQFLKVSP